MVHDCGSPIGDCQPTIYLRNMSLHPKKFAGYYRKNPESLPSAKQAEIASTRQYSIRIHQIPQWFLKCKEASIEQNYLSNSGGISISINNQQVWGMICITRHIYIYTCVYMCKYIYMSDCENPRFTERTSTNLGRSHRLPHVCTIMIYGKLGGYRLQETAAFIYIYIYVMNYE